MSQLLISSVQYGLRYLLQPIIPFTWFGLKLSVLDVAATLRLCIVLRQIREMNLAKLLKQARTNEEKKSVEEPSSFKSIAAALVVVYGGEAAMCSWLGTIPSFIHSPVGPLLYTVGALLVEQLPCVPAFSAQTEFPLSLFDGLSRAVLVCTLIPPIVLNHTQEKIASSPWALLLSSFMIANAGFFFANMFSMFSPTGFAVSTPPELLAYGWTTLDLWIAPLVTATFALLTHAQPFWIELHDVLAAIAGPYAADSYNVHIKAPSAVTFLTRLQPLGGESARAVCAIILTASFVSRSVYNYGWPSLLLEQNKVRVRIPSIKDRAAEEFKKEKSQ